MRKNTNKMKQTTAVLSLLKSRRKSKMTAHQIADAVRTKYGVKFTPVQISKTLNKFKNAKIVNSVDKNGVSPAGISVYRWCLPETKS